MQEKFGKGEIPLPDFWGGYRVCPGASNSGRAASTACTIALTIRLEDAGDWAIEQLQP